MELRPGLTSVYSPPLDLQTRRKAVCGPLKASFAAKQGPRQRFDGPMHGKSRVSDKTVAVYLHDPSQDPLNGY